MATPTMVVARRFTNPPISRRSAVTCSSGTSANGIPNDRMTCEMTSATTGSIPRASTTKAGAMVMVRRSHTGIRRRRKPSMTTCPASVPMLDDDSPDASRATPNSTSAWPPTTDPSPSYTRVRSSPISVRPAPLKTVAAMTSIDRFTSPAMVMAITTSTTSKRKSLRRAAGSAAGTRRWVRAEWR